MSEINTSTISKIEDASTELRPLQRKDTKGVLYERSKEVDEQIRRALFMSTSKLLRSASNNDWKTPHPDYLKEECLVYMIGEYHIRGDHRTMGALLNTILERMVKRIRSSLRPLGKTLAEEAEKEVLERLVPELMDPFERGAFLQVRFGQRLNRLVIDQLRRYSPLKEHRENYVSIEEKSDEQSAGSVRDILYEADEATNEPPASPEELLVKLEESRLLYDAIDSLPDEKLKNAFVLKYLEGYGYSELGKYFDVPGETVRNWTRKARTLLAEWIKKHE